MAVAGLRGGLTTEHALAAVTIDAARVVGVDARLGSLEAGKDGDVVLFDGDPFAAGTKVTAVLVSGRLVYTVAANRPQESHARSGPLRK